MSMQIQAVATEPIELGSDIINVLDRYLPKLAENTIIAITSKIISLSQKRVIYHQDVQSRNDLIKGEADGFIANEYANGDICLTIKNNILVPFAGIDESNGNGCYILYPTNIQASASMIWQYLREKNNISNLGIIITDSNITPLRRGVTGIAIGWCGFKPLYSYVGKSDIYGRIMKMTYINNLDALAASAVLIMGEGNECIPMAMITNAPRIEFLSTPSTDVDMQEITISLDEDFYAPVLRAVDWTWNRK